MPMALLKQAIAYEYMLQNSCDKLIFLGADTLTAGRLDEFLDDDKTEVIVTACFPYQFFAVDNTKVSNFIENFNVDNKKLYYINSLILILEIETGKIILTDSPVTMLDTSRFQVLEYYLANPDVVCYNSPAALKTQLDAYFKFYFSYAEFGALNYALKHHSFKFADLKPTYEQSDVVYNSRAKVEMANPKTFEFQVRDNKLYDSRGKNVKVYHFQEQFTKDHFLIKKQKDLYKKIMRQRVNKATIKFFKGLDIDIINI
jgi:hypothetical protein